MTIDRHTQHSTPHLHPERDRYDLDELVWKAIVRARRQRHGGRLCGTLLHGGCALCDHLHALAVRRVEDDFRKAPDPRGWPAPQIAKRAQYAMRDAVRARLAAAGLGHRPERWLTQASFLPDAARAARVLVVTIIMMIGYGTRLPARDGRLRLTVPDLAWILGRLQHGRNQAVASAAGRSGRTLVERFLRAWHAAGGSELELPLLHAQLTDALDEWSRSAPAAHEGLLRLNEENPQFAGWERLPEATVEPAAHRPDDEQVERLRGLFVSTEHGDRLLARYLASIQRLATQDPNQVRRNPERLRELLWETAAGIADTPGAPRWLLTIGRDEALTGAFVNEAALRLHAAARP